MSVLLNHHFGSFDHSGDGIAFFEFEFVGAAPRDGALDEIISNPNDHMGHDIAELDFFNFSAKFVSG